MGLSGFFEILNVFCLTTRIIDVKTPLCTFDSDEFAWKASIGGNDPSQAIKLRLMAMPNTMGIEVPKGPIGKAEAEAIMSSAISSMRIEAFAGTDAMSEDELEYYMAQLMAPEPTTMLTVSASPPPTQSPH